MFDATRAPAYKLIDFARNFIQRLNIFTNFLIILITFHSNHSNNNIRPQDPTNSTDLN